MKVKVIVKQSSQSEIREFTLNAQAIHDDKNIGEVTFDLGEVERDLFGDKMWLFKEDTQKIFAWKDIERLEVTP